MAVRITKSSLAPCSRSRNLQGLSSGDGSTRLDRADLLSLTRQCYSQGMEPAPVTTDSSRAAAIGGNSPNACRLVSSAPLQQVNHGLLAYTNIARARPVKIDNYGKNQADGYRQDEHGKDIPTSVHTERISDQHS
jgi:hypothetical protein